jgi:hypothetical protein
MHALVLAAGLGGPPVLISALFIPLLSRAAAGRLQRNQWVGIRTAATMRSDQAWIAGHRAALRLAPLYVLTTILSCAALIAAALFAPTISAITTAGLGSVGAILAVFVYSAAVASKAAKSAGGEPGNGTLH